MNRNIFSSFCMLFLLAFAVQAQDGNTLPNAEIENMEGLKVQTADFSNDGKPFIISFWASWCKPCIKELTAIHDLYEEWQEETGVKVIAISIDDARNAALVPMIVNQKEWPYEIYLDKNSDFKRAMNVVNIPHTFLIDGEGRIVYQHTSYAPGDEEELYDHVLELMEGGD
jgi:cytochrome c biogenesis protein CcmG/thiol:disulfide interchange protein DsbE